MAESRETISTIMMPEGAMIIGGVTLVSYIDADGDECWGYSINGVSSDTAIALLEKMKSAVVLEAITEMTPLDEPDDEDDY